MAKSQSSTGTQGSGFKISTVENLVDARKTALDRSTSVDQAGRYFFTSADEYPFPNLIEIQLDSYQWFLEEGIRELFDEVSPIIDFSGKKIELHFLDHSFETPKYDPETAKKRNLSYESTLKVHVRLVNKETGEIKEQDIYLGNIPLMTDKGTFVVNGIERVVVNQLVRSPGVFFGRNASFPKHYTAKIIPKRGVWLELETDKKGIIHVKIDRRRKVYLTSLLRIFGYETDKEILNLFADLRQEGQPDFILNTLEKDTAKTSEEAYQAIYRKLRPGDMATAANAKQLIDSMFFDFKRYDMSVIARYKMNKRFDIDLPHDIEHRVFQVSDLVHISRHLIDLNNGNGKPDDIDHLSNRRVRSVGELVQNKFRIGLLRTERIAKDRMTVLELDTVTPTQLINARPITAVMREFYASSQLSQFMDQTNPLSELAHKRRLSAMGPGGLSRERASFDVRDVHTSHYGRICPIATPEGPNIGLVVHLATYAKINEFGFIETPFRTVAHTVPNKESELVGRMAGEDISDDKKKVIVKKDVVIDKAIAAKIAKVKQYKDGVPVRAYLTDTVEYYDADDEQNLTIAQSNTETDELRQIVEKQVASREKGEPIQAHVNEITHMDVSPKQIISVTTSLIPFLEHDDNTRASMGTNMQRQAVSLINPQSPLVGTGMEGLAARSSGHVVVAEKDGIVESVDAGQMALLYKNGEKKIYNISTYHRSNQATSLHMRPTVVVGQKVKKGQVLTDGPAIRDGELALGQNLMVAYMSWEGYNFEDAVIVSDRVYREGDYDSIHIESYTVDVRDTKLGPEIVTRDIPNVGEDKLKDLDSEGVVRIGAFLKEGDILVGKITPKGETDLSPEERLLQAIFGDKAKDVKDTSLRLPGGTGGKVVDIQIFSRADGDDLSQGIIKQIKVYVAQMRKIQVGDKMAGRHGNKGVISRIVPQEDMPYLPDGTPVDIILNPLGVSSRMNIGQILETHLGWAANVLGFKVATPVLNGVPMSIIDQLLADAGLPEDGKIQLCDGKTGELFDHKTCVGMVYMLKLLHLVEDKIHARSVGPYSLVTQQPLGGKAQHGGQRFGEMEVWALEAYGAAHALQEVLTIKSDDIFGRSKAYESIVKHEEIRKPSTPESFNVLVRELQSLGLSVDLMDRTSGEHVEVEEVIETSDEDADIVESASRDKVKEMVGGEAGVVDEGIEASDSLDEMEMEEEKVEAPVEE
ncbi:MAG: DNA-directed RNA polymerase subunit beta [Candidatus Gracilibacteria bacterium]|nr:DNA-directed RNA polymerase subunit beta [Candidatus Gracilibacteria bacterium]